MRLDASGVPYCPCGNRCEECLDKHAVPGCLKEISHCRKQQVKSQECEIYLENWKLWAYNMGVRQGRDPWKKAADFTHDIWNNKIEFNPEKTKAKVYFLGIWRHSDIDKPGSKKNRHFIPGGDLAPDKVLEALPLDEQISVPIQSRYQGIRPEIDPKKALEIEEFQEAFLDCREKLPFLERTAFILYALENKRVKEIQNIMERCKDSVQLYLSKAREALKNCLRRKGVL